MGKALKRVAALTLVMCMVISGASFAHSGRTDSSGGHKDNQNKSGLGYYHYHHGYGPHLHTDGVCPYSVSTTPQSSTATVVKHDHEHGSLPAFNIAICNSEVQPSDMKYPVFVYNDITYLPMTWTLCTSLGLSSEFDINTGLSITTGQVKSAEYIPTSDRNVSSSDGLDIKESNIVVRVDDQVLNQKDEYPMMSYNDVIYLPLTWDNAAALGLAYTYTAEDGLVIE